MDPLEDFDAYEDNDVGLGEEDKKYAKGDRKQWFKGEKGAAYRVSFMYFHPITRAIIQAARKKNPEISREDLTKLAKSALGKRAEELGKPADQLQDHEILNLDVAKFHRVEAHFKEGIGFAVSRLGMDGAEADAIWNMMGEKKSYFCTVLLVYPCNREGEVNKDMLKAGNFDVKPWRLSAKVYGQLHQVAAGLRSNDLSIASQDLILKCTNTDYQNFDIQPSGKALWRRIAPLQASVLPKVVALYDEMRKPFRELSTADLAIKLGVSTAGTGGNQGSDVDADDFDELLDQV